MNRERVAVSKGRRGVGAAWVVLAPLLIFALCLFSPIPVAVLGGFQGRGPA